MTVLDNVRKMQEQGKNEEEIIRALRDEGVSYKDISDSLAQSKIKAAIDAPTDNSNEDQYPQALPPGTDTGQQIYEDPQGYETQYQEPQNDAQYQNYDYQQQAASTDTISEVAEQIIDEKMEKFNTLIEKMRSADKTSETKIAIIEERLKRLEKIIDTLQLSVLRKVGDFITNVEDIKKELIETQKSFSKVIPALKKKGKTTTKKTTRKKK